MSKRLQRARHALFGHDKAPRWRVSDGWTLEGQSWTCKCGWPCNVLYSGTQTAD